MAILVDTDTKVIVQGITGKAGEYYVAQMLAYGTNVVAGVSPGHGGDWIHGTPIFDSVRSAIEVTDADASVVFVPASHAADAICEAIDARVRLIVCVAENIPFHDMMRVREFLRLHPGTRLIGAQAAGILIPGRVSLGVIPPFVALAGHVGVVARSGTLLFDVVYTLSCAHIGQSAVIGLGSDAVSGMSLVDVMMMFEDDPETRAAVMIGSAGGAQELEAARYVHKMMSKPVYAYVVGRSFLRSSSFLDMLRASGVVVVETPAHLAKLLLS